MESNNKIIAIRKVDKPKALRHFEELMKKTEAILNNDAKKNTSDYKKLSASGLEECARDKIIEACQDTLFDPNEVKLISGHRFPDIVTNTYYGVEVKSTKSNHWTSIGSSILESTRDVNVDDIYMLFGKLGGDVPEFRCRPYESVLYDIAVTHSPRYLINMDLGEKDTIFRKIGITYDELRTSDDSIAVVRKYFREKAKKEKRVEMPWWITSDNANSSQSFNIQLWNTLPSELKEELQAKCMILFPEALNPKPSQTKYNNTSLWLCSYSQVVVPNIRDFYTAGGKITHVNGDKLKTDVPQVFNRIVKFSKSIQEILDSPSTEMLMLIKDYNPSLYKSSNRYKHWLDLCCKYAEEYNIPLKDWIEEKPKFSFSKK